MNTAYGLIDGDSIQYAGGADTTFTYKTDNTYTANYAKMKPRIAKHRGNTYTYVMRGTVTLRYHADGDTNVLSMVRNNSTNELRRNGAVVSRGPTSFLLESQQYRCTSERLLLSSSQGNYTIDAVKISGP
ncbi:hypothetical protein [Phytohabitans rumicis]|nr:hypothetical protein [Phytohabitans rumicis]